MELLMYYDEIRPQIRTGDLLYWRGAGLFSNAIRMAQRMAGHDDEAADISHVGMAIWADDIGNHPLWPDDEWRMPGRLLTFESTTLNEVPDAITGAHIQGVSLVPLTDKWRAYDGFLEVRHLRNAPAKFQPALLEFIQATHGRPYEKSGLRLLASVISASRSWIEKDMTTMFCSETVREALQACGCLVDGSEGTDSKCPAEIYRIDALMKSPAHYLPSIHVVKRDAL
jgi:hypothetical protein